MCHFTEKIILLNLKLVARIAEKYFTVYPNNFLDLNTSLTERILLILVCVCVSVYVHGVTNIAVMCCTVVFHTLACHSGLHTSPAHRLLVMLP